MTVAPGAVVVPGSSSGAIAVSVASSAGGTVPSGSQSGGILVEDLESSGAVNLVSLASLGATLLHTASIIGATVVRDDVPATWIDVADYGAVGDDSTDCTAAFAAAINAAYRSDMTGASAFTKHRRVIMRPGVYRVQHINAYSSSDNNGVWLDAPEGAVVRGITDGDNVINFRGNDCRLSNVTVTRLGSQSLGHGVHIGPETETTLLRLRLDNVNIVNQPQDGLNADRLEHAMFSNVTCNTSGRYGWYFYNTGVASQGFENYLVGCSARNSISTGLFISDQQNFTVMNFEALNNDLNGGVTGCQIKVNSPDQSSSGHVFINPDVENFDGDHAGRGIEMIGSGNSVIGGSGWELKFGIYLTSANYTRITGFKSSRSQSLSSSAVVFLDGGCQNNYVEVPDGANMANRVSYDSAILSSANQTLVGPTGSRPSAGVRGAGAIYYDTTTHVPAWSDGTNWRDVAGNII